MPTKSSTPSGAHTPIPPLATRLAQFPRRHPVWLALLIALLLLIVFFDWNWFRHPLERYVSKKTERVFTISDLHVRLGWNPSIRMRDVYFANAAWSKEDAMARIEQLEFSVSLRDLPDKVLVPRVALTKPVLIFERLADGRKNWRLADPDDTSPSKLRISTLSVDQGQLKYLDHGEPFAVDIAASTFDPAAAAKVTDAKAAPANKRYSTRYRFSGNYHGAGFSGNAQTGEVISFQESGVPFPIQGDLVAGTTKVQVEGTIADAMTLSGIDTRLRIEGQTLANLYPFLLLPLPASPPYQLQGHLVLKGSKYTMDDLTGKIGSTDVHGQAGYEKKEPRPLLTASLHSNMLNISDLGPLIGVQTKESGGKPAISQAQTSTKASATQAQKVVDPNHILPAGTFDGSRLQKIDAEVDLDAKQLKVPAALPLESLRASLRLHDAVLKMEPLEFGFAGGLLTSQVTLDARQPVLAVDAQIAMRRVRVDRLLPPNATLAKGAGLLGATAHLKGRGNSIADAAAKANGSVSAAVSNGRVSNLLDAASGLNGGKVLQLLAGGDRDIKVNCGGLAFDVKNGQGKSTLFLVDTEQTQIVGDGVFDLERETLEMKITPKPKRMGILSLRTPVRLFGTFKNPDYALEKGPLLARVAGAVALATVAPLAALIPLIETGPGEDSNCARITREVGAAEKQAVAAAPRKK